MCVSSRNHRHTGEGSLLHITQISHPAGSTPSKTGRSLSGSPSPPTSLSSNERRAQGPRAVSSTHKQCRVARQQLLHSSNQYLALEHLFLHVYYSSSYSVNSKRSGTLSHQHPNCLKRCWALSTCSVNVLNAWTPSTILGVHTFRHISLLILTTTHGGKCVSYLLLHNKHPPQM